MQTHQPTTPFGRQTLTLAYVASQAVAKACPPEKAAHKWNVFRDICAAKDRLAVSDRALALLNALLSFHQETVLSGSNLIVFPSNRQLGLRANGMAPATLRRHLAVLVDAGIIIRRDSPNGKRYARKDRAGEIESAFGFDLTPMVARAEEYERLATAVRQDEKTVRLLRERITLCRRDIVKMISTGIEEGVAAPQGWEAIHAAYKAIMVRMPRSATRDDLEPVAEGLKLLADELFSLLESHTNSTNTSGNESQNEQHIQNSNPEPLYEVELVSREDQAEKPSLSNQPVRKPQAYPLSMVLSACPDVAHYARGGISSWNDLISTINLVVRPSLGISPSAWQAAKDAMGEIPAAITVAAMLQRAEAITSAGGYLRDLTRRAGEGKFSVGPMLMALLAQSKGKARA
ncbi:plasmid replication protein RepC [Lichenifustis flavocetrariae]|uniref:Replication initiation protein RepC n=1 Tax=Lichenifustis flavocetrariae TaxID=2949735 RepID=A0AA42CS01_9HYPH|nr:plasmid replication protein RepC [Lichenifustis flavocetrariae]MCW6513022.1 replication initiation protein RepC [Lichenifustis flavocetrariae]